MAETLLKKRLFEVSFSWTSFRAGSSSAMIWSRSWESRFNVIILLSWEIPIRSTTGSSSMPLEAVWR